MSARQYYTLHCDGDGCEARHTSDLHRADLTRSAAARLGWVHGIEPPAPNRGGPARSLDYCPAHADQLGALSPKTLPEHARPA